MRRRSKIRTITLAIVTYTLLAGSAWAQSQGRLDKRTLEQRFPRAGRVYATGATCSSTYGRGYEDSTATGKPNVFPRLGDNRGSWACENQNSAAEWLSVTFPPTEAEYVLIFETNAPGAVRKVEADGAVIFETSDPPKGYNRSQVLWIALPAPKQVTTVKIHVAPKLVRGWPEIDTVSSPISRASPYPRPREC